MLTPAEMANRKTNTIKRKLGIPLDGMIEGRDPVSGKKEKKFKMNGGAHELDESGSISNLSSVTRVSEVSQCAIFFVAFSRLLLLVWKIYNTRSTVNKNLTHFFISL